MAVISRTVHKIRGGNTYGDANMLAFCRRRGALLSGNRNMVTGSDSGIIFAESVPYLVDLGSGRRESIYLQHRKDIVRIQVIRRGVNNSGGNDAVVSGA